MVYKARLHPDAIRQVGDRVWTNANGAVNVAVPDCASGIRVQRHADRDGVVNSNVYMALNTVNTPMTGVDQGFSLPSNSYPENVWFDPAQIKFVNFWLEDSAELIYRFIVPARPI